MEKITNFEELRCWKAARQLSKLVYVASEKGKLARDFETRAQIKSAALSGVSNIAEGFGRFSNKEFIRFLDISRGSVNEVKSITYTLEDVEYLPITTIMEIREKAEETKNIILAFIKYLRTKCP
jgi:four helix bundle protein